MQNGDTRVRDSIETPLCNGVIKPPVTSEMCSHSGESTESSAFEALKQTTYFIAKDVTVFGDCLLIQCDVLGNVLGDVLGLHAAFFLTDANESKFSCPYCR